MEPVLGQYKLTVLPHAQATKILFGDGAKSNVAVGVQVKRFGTVMNFYSSKETIISAGAIGKKTAVEV